LQHRGADHAPALVSYQSDGWSTWVKSRISTSTGVLTICREGRTRKEFLLERSIYKTIDESGKISAAMTLSPPRPMDKGLKGWHIFGASLDHTSMARLQGHTGLVCSMYGQDGLHYEQFLRHHRARHRLYYHPDIFAGDADDRFLLSNMDIVLGFRCRLHINQNGVKWGLRAHSTKQLLEDVHISLKALINTSADIRDRARQFIARHLVFDVGLTTPREQREVFWKALGVPVDMLEELLVLNLRWDVASKQLLVDPRMRDDPMCISRVDACLQYCLSWISFSESRFSKTGACGRRWLLSQAVGADALYDDMVNDPEVNNGYYANGYSRCCSEDVRKFLCVAAFASLPAEAVSLELLEDDRLLRRYAELLEVFHSELDYVRNMPEGLFQEISMMAGLHSDGAALKQWVLLSMHISAGYMHRGTFADVQRDPLRLTQGDIAANVETLLDDRDLPTDVTVRQLWNCLRMGVSARDVRQLLELLRDAPYTTGLCEKGHGQGAAVAKKHSEYCQDSLLERSMTNESRRLLAVNTAELYEATLQAKLERAQKFKCTTSSKNMFCADLMAQRSSGIADGRELVATNSSCVRDHHALFNHLSAAEKISYSQVASKERRRRNDANRESMRFLQWEVNSQRQRQREREDGDEGVANTMSSMRYSDEDLDELATIWNSASFKGRELQEAWERTTSSVMAPTAHEIRLETDEKSQPWWVSIFTGQRDAFVGTAIFAEAGDGDEESGAEVFYFLYASKGPQCVVFLKASRCDRVWPAWELLGPGEEPDFDPMVHEYDYTGYEYVDAIDLNFGEEARLWLLTGVEFNIGSSTLVVRSNAVPFETFVLGLPEPPPRPPQERSSATRRLPKNVVLELMEEFPWLTEDDINGAASEHRHGESQRRDGGARTGEAMPLPTDAVDAVDAHDLAALLVERRDEWDMDFSSRWRAHRRCQRFRQATSKAMVSTFHLAATKRFLFQRLRRHRRQQVSQILGTQRKLLFRVMDRRWLRLASSIQH
jgi:hypothetical protein